MKKSKIKIVRDCGRGLTDFSIVAYGSEYGHCKENMREELLQQKRVDYGVSQGLP